MARAPIDGIELDYAIRGTGDPVVLVHWGVCAAWAEPLLEAPALSERYRLLSYHRAGFGNSGHVEGPLSMADHAEQCCRLMRHVDIERAHIVGHSSSAAIALQLALDAPEAVQTLTLMDAARPAPQTETQAAFARGFAEPAIQRYHTGDTAAAVDTFFRGVFGPRYREALEEGLPGAFDQAVADADAFFGQELPALYQWSFTEQHARRVSQPVLLVHGEHSAPTFAERRDLLLSWLPNAEPFELPGANHLLHVENPNGIAEALDGFFARQAATARSYRGRERPGTRATRGGRPAASGSDRPSERRPRSSRIRH
jgi:pimeloyl-ACP methyl ester carboxylesterase